MAYDLSGFQGKLQATIAALPAAPEPKNLLLIAKAIEATTPTVAVSDILAASTSQQAIIAAQGTAAIGAINDARDDAIEAIQQAGQGSAAASGISFAPTGGIGATNVQSAIAELDAEKIATSAIGSAVQAYDADLAAIAGLPAAADRLPYFTGPGAATLATFTAAARALLDDADAATMLRTLGLTDGAGKLLASLLPALAITDVFPVATQAAMLALTAQRGDVAIRTDQGVAYILATDDPTVLGNWTALPLPAGVVMQVAGLSGPSITGAQLIAALAAFGGDAGAGGTKGLVPAPASGDAAGGKFLRADGTWAVPAGTGGGSSGGMTDDDRIAWIEIAKLKATALRLATSAADDFKDQSGISIPETAQTLPAMTGNAAPSGSTASASSEYNQGALEAAYLAFDQKAGTQWTANVTGFPQWLQRTFDTPVRHGRYSITQRADGTGNTLTAWQILGVPADGSANVVLDTRTGQSFATGETKTFDIPAGSQGVYKGYRLNITAGAGYASVAEFALMRGGDSTNAVYDAANNLVTNLVSGSPAAMDLRSVAFQAQAVPTKGSIFALVKATAGTIALNTNLTASLSRDGGTTNTTVTLQNLGTLPNGYTIIEANNVDISGQPSGSSPRYRIQTVGTALAIALDAVVFSWG